MGTKQFSVGDYVVPTKEAIFRFGKINSISNKRYKIRRNGDIVDCFFIMNDAGNEIEVSSAYLILEEKVVFEEGDTIEMLESCSGCEKGKQYILGISYVGDLCALDKTQTLPDGCRCKSGWKLIKKVNETRVDVDIGKTEKNDGWMPIAEYKNVIKVGDKIAIKGVYPSEEIRKKPILSPNNIFMNIVEKARNLLLSKESKLLKEAGLEDPENIPTEAGKEILWDILWSKYRPDVVAVAQQVKDEEQKNKKA